MFSTIYHGIAGVCGSVGIAMATNTHSVAAGALLGFAGGALGSAIGAIRGRVPQ